MVFIVGFALYTLPHSDLLSSVFTVNSMVQYVKVVDRWKPVVKDRQKSGMYFTYRERRPLTLEREPKSHQC
jgi:hypothetical protein